jgi:hypothetical protein
MTYHGFMDRSRVRTDLFLLLSLFEQEKAKPTNIAISRIEFFSVCIFLNPKKNLNSTDNEPNKPSKLPQT